MSQEFKDRIKSFRRVKPSQLKPNPKNWRLHEEQQTAALTGVLERVGYADAVLAREDEDGNLVLIDGHLRTSIAGKDDKVPVLVLDVTEAEGDLILATHDPLALLAGRDQSKLDELVASLEPGENESVGALMASLKSAPAIDGDGSSEERKEPSGKRAPQRVQREEERNKNQLAFRNWVIYMTQENADLLEEKIEEFVAVFGTSQGIFQRIARNLVI